MRCYTLITLVGLQAIQAADWDHWRGPDRNGIVDEASGWQQKGWGLGKQAWTANVGEGSTSPLVAQKKVYTMGWQNNQDTVFCLDAATGRPLWKVSYPCPQFGRLATGDQGMFSGPTSTPELDRQTGYVYTLSCDGDLNCWDATGRNVWRLNLYDKYQVGRRPRVNRSGQRDYGYTSSPLVHGDWLIVEVGAQAGNLIAFDKRTGQQAWTSEATSPAGHTGGPVPMTIDGVPCLAVHNFDGLLVVRLDAGHTAKTVATYPWSTDFANNVVTPAVHGNSVLLTSGYNHCRMTRFDIGLATGAKQVWEVGEFSQVCSPVIHAGHVYWAWRHLRCLDFKSGRTLWEGGRFGDPGSIVVTRDQQLIVWANHGDLALVDLASRSPDRYEQRGWKTALSSVEAWPHLALSDGNLYCKDRAGTLVCFRLETH